MFYDNAFFAGCESLMEDDTVEAEAKVTITPEEQAEEVAEAEEQATEQAETTAEVEQGAQQTELVFRKFDEIDRMIKHVETFGVDKAFLSLCNHNNILNKSFGLGLPAVESFNEQPSPYSAVSQAALEGLKETAVKVWEFIKRMIAKAGDWIVRIAKMYDLRRAMLNSKINKIKARIKSGIVDDAEKAAKAEGKVVAADKLAKVIQDCQTTLDKDAKSEVPSIPAAEVELKTCKLLNVSGYVTQAETAVKALTDGLKAVATKRNKVSELNNEAAKLSGKEENKDEVKRIKNAVVSFQNEIKVINKGLSTILSAGSVSISAAAKIIASCCSDKKEEKK